MNRKTISLFLLLSLFSCTSTPFADYEVPTLPEEVIGKSLKTLTLAMERHDLEGMLAAYAPDFRTPGHDPGLWEPRSDSNGIRTSFWRTSGKKADLDAKGVRDGWKRYLSSFLTITRAEAKPRIMNVVETDAACTYYLDIRGVDDTGAFRNDRLWVRFWLRQDAEEWRIVAQQMMEGDSTRGKRTAFREIARENGTAYPHTPSPMFGPKEMERQNFPLVVRGDSGLAAADYDGDGWVDLYYCDGMRNALMRNRGDGTFEDVTKKAGLELPQKISRSAIFADFDNDADMDLFVTYEQFPCRFFENVGGGKFQDRTEHAGLGYEGFPTSLSVVDYDNDGLLDLYVAVYGDFYSEFPTIKTKNGDPNRLFRNVGGLRFEDVTDFTGVGDNGWTLACTWGDYDNDGDPDLFVCNDFGQNSLFRNEGGTFTDMTYLSGVAVDGFGMSVSFGDYDNDGDMDVYLSGMYSNAGQWIFNKKELLPVPDFVDHIRQNVFGMLDYMTDGNRLLRNEGNGKFTEVAKKAGVDYGQFAWASPWFDFDNDGFLDLYCNNGFWTGPDTDDL